jgi:hypothetical protein
LRRLIRKTTSFWERPEGLTYLLVLLVGSIFVAPLLKDEFPFLAAVGTGLLILLFVVGAFVLARNAWAAIAVSLLAASAISLEVVRELDPTDPLAAWRLGAAGLTIGLFASVTLARVFAPGEVNSHRLIGAVDAFLLVGLTWAYVYDLLETLRPGSFTGVHGASHGSYPALLYFSFVTLTTVGYGDISPVSSAARALCNLESLVGVLYPAILIGRLLTKQGAGHGPEPPAAG